MGPRIAFCQAAAVAAIPMLLVRVFTVDDGWGWIFTAVEHWNARVCRLACRVKRMSDRFAASAADLHGA